MACGKSSEITAFLKGEVPGTEREALQAHFDGCAHCSQELEKSRRLLESFSTIETVEPSPEFTWRVRDAFLRARRTRSRRPHLVAQSRAWGLAGLFAALPFGMGTAGSWTLWWAIVDWHLGMVETADGRERQLSAADALTLARLWAAPIVRRHPEPRSPTPPADSLPQGRPDRWSVSLPGQQDYPR